MLIVYAWPFINQTKQGRGWKKQTLSLVFFLQNKRKLQFPDIKVLTQQAKGAGALVAYCSGENSGNDKLIKIIINILS